MNQLFVVLVACVTILACGDPPTAAERDAIASSPVRSLVPLDRFGIGQGGRGNACTAPEYRQFDFWVGYWDIKGPGESTIANSTIRSVLGGCAIVETFQGGLGRSLSAYDDATQTWNQIYTGPFGALLQLRGGFRRDSMVLEIQLSPTLKDVWSWTTVSSTEVRQQLVRYDNGLVAPGNFFNGLYVRRADEVVVPPPPVSVCARAQSREMDFLLGTWDVYEGQAMGNGAAQGTLSVTTTAGGCMMEESLTGPAGFKALAFGSYGQQGQRWFRTHMDTDGRYLRLSGTRQGSRMVMTGNRIGAMGALVVVRVTWEPTAPDRVTQRWEFSLDGGTTFVSEQEYTFVRAAGA